MEPISTMNLRENLPECYKASVNESETITEAQPLCWGRRYSETSGFRAADVFPAVPHIERS
jgi:hypothetical protein